jgi:hypothetical protein
MSQYGVLGAPFCIGMGYAMHNSTLKITRNEAFVYKKCL